MIKATDLMQNDWFSGLNYSNERDFFQHDIYEIECFDDCEPEPIPLTEDILLANGFEAKHGYFRYNDENDFYLVTWNEISHHLILRTFDNDCSLDKDHVDYVHELQQVLRLCGLSELADNFKIE